MTSSPAQARPLPEHNKQPDVDPTIHQLTNVEKATKAQADKAQRPGSSNTKS